MFLVRDSFRCNWPNNIAFHCQCVHERVHDGKFLEEKWHLHWFKKQPLSMSTRKPDVHVDSQSACSDVCDPEEEEENSVLEATQPTEPTKESNMNTCSDNKFDGGICIGPKSEFTVTCARLKSMMESTLNLAKHDKNCMQQLHHMHNELKQRIRAKI